MMFDMQDIYEKLNHPTSLKIGFCAIWLRIFVTKKQQQQVNCMHTTAIITCMCKIHKAISVLSLKTFIIIQKALVFIYILTMC